MDNIIRNIAEIQQEIIDLSHNIHANPELGFEEKNAVGLMRELLLAHGFSFESPLAGLDTAFKARYRGKEEGPKIAFLAEYDALQGVGHACGHNIIASVAIGAAIGLSKCMQELPGEIMVIGTPAEEGGGGKIILLKNGEFEGVDYALMIHPSNQSLIGRGAQAAVAIKVGFNGQKAHSAVPEMGINALTSLIQVFNNLDAIRDRLPGKHKVNGIITSGGSAVNIIPDYAEGHFLIRGEKVSLVKEIALELKRAIKSASILTGATYEIEEGLYYAERYPNMVMAERFKEKMYSLGERMSYAKSGDSLGSSDIGNISMCIPAIHPYLKIGDDITGHTQGFCQAAVSSRGDEVTVKGAQGLALTAYDILTEEAFREKINQEFQGQVKSG